MTRTGEHVAALGVALASTDPAALLPAQRAAEQGRLVAPLALHAALDLGPARTGPGRCFAAMVVDQRGSLLAGPLVLDGDAARRAVPGDGATAALARLIRGGTEVAEGFEMVTLSRPGPLAEARDEAAIAVDQTQESVVLAAATGAGAGAGGVVVKWAVHIEPAAGDPPAVSAVRHLHAAGFTEMPTPYGFLLGDVDGASVLIASVSGYLPGAQDGWDWCVDDVLSMVEGGMSLSAAAEPAAALGALVARMHLAFARPGAGSGPGAAVTQARAEDLAAWMRRATATLEEALAVTTGAEGERLGVRAAAAREVLSSLEGLSPASTATTRIHGDLHVGQVLRWRGRYAVSDFDGNPVLPAAERVQPQPPARDVAGMLRALDHVGRIVARRTEGRAAALVDDWIGASRTAFLAAYRSEMGRADASALFDPRLLGAFEVEQECRELVYAARHLPRWTYVPDAALGPLLDHRPLAGEEAADRETAVPPRTVRSRQDPSPRLGRPAGPVLGES